ncbi:MAG TPA: KUP/HAK/KT family potassium transporter, partial [Candidatus Acidoferrum sp.]|nr:KUP/HAK/KT family potassium transporter [Candidatus Acidoferrum sp.]
MNESSGEPARGEGKPADGSPSVPGHHSKAPRGKALALLAFGALGVVYGDIGTSPLYAVRECFSGVHGIPVNRVNVLGVLSLIFWALTLIISIKYIAFVLRADNHGEGGVLSLLALALPEKRGERTRGLRKVVILLGVFGAALLYGDGIITPAVSILSAVEGLKVATPQCEPFVIPITIVILIGLFAVQRTGTKRVGAVFGPVTLVWFISIAVLGVRGISRDWTVLAAVNPWYAVNFMMHAGHLGFFVLGAVVLAITGGEALYADMGHFGRRPIRLAWYGLVLPSLVLNYFGQGALLLSDPTAKGNPFYNLCPTWALIPMVIVATSAAIIASQALISGAFSLTMQAIQLGYSPRMKIDHTSSETRGQIYMPLLNWTLMFACIGLVLGFKSSSNLTAAYGVAVTFTMFVTTILFYFAAIRLWGWKPVPTALLCGVFLVIEGALCMANLV